MQNIYFSVTQTIMEKMRHSYIDSNKNGSIIRSSSNSRDSSMRRIIESRNKWSQTHIVKKQLTNGCKNGSEYVAARFCLCIFVQMCERLVHSRFFVGSVIAFTTPPTHKIIPTRMTLYTFYVLKKTFFFAFFLARTHTHSLSMTIFFITLLNFSRNPLRLIYIYGYTYNNKRNKKKILLSYINGIRFQSDCNNM